MLDLEQSIAANLSALDPAYEQFREQTRFWIQKVAVPLLMVIGLFGNLITMIIMTRRGMRSTTNMYLAALAFVDMLYLVLTFLLSLSHYDNIRSTQYYIYWKLRPFLMMLTDACSNTSVWLTVTFTIERYIAVKYPMKGKVWCTEKRAKMMIICVFMLGTLFATPVPFEWKVIEKKAPANITQWSVATPINGLPSSSVSAAATASASLAASDAFPAASSNSAPLATSHNVTSSINLPQNPQATGLQEGGQQTNDLTATAAAAATAAAEKKLAGKNDELVAVPAMASNASYILSLDYSDFGRNETYKIFYYGSIAVIFYFVPLFSLMLFNGFLIKSVHQSKRERTRMTRRTIGSIQAQRLPNYHQERPSKVDLNLLRVNNCNNNSGNQLMEAELRGGECCENSGTSGSATVGEVGLSGSSVRKFSLNRLNKFKSFLYPSRHKKERTSRSQDCSTIQGSSLRYPFITQHNGAQDKLTLDNRAQQNFTQIQPLLSETATSTTASTTTVITTVPLKPPSATSRNPASETAIIEPSEASVQSSSCDSGAAIRRVEGSEGTTAPTTTTKTNKSKHASNENSIQKDHLSQADRLGKGSTATIRTIEELPNRLAQMHKRSLTSNAACSSSQQTIVPASSTQERRITIMLIAVVILFLFCQIPSAAMLLYTSVRELEPNTNEHALVLAFGNIFNFLVAVNAAGNFILYSFLSKKYRRTFVILFCSCLGSKQKQQQANRMLSVRFETSRMSQRNSSSIYQNSNRVNDKVRKDTLV